jgi:hypothetical protein
VAGALIVTAELAAQDLAWLDSLRRRYFPPERNLLRAHLTMFHAVPPSAEAEVRRLLGQLSVAPPPRAEIAGLMSLGRGVAFRVVSDDLKAIRRTLAEALHGLLTAQDSGGWAPHVTVQNKVDAPTARRTLRELEAGFSPAPLGISGLGLHRYLGGPWEPLRLFPFRGRGA